MKRQLAYSLSSQDQKGLVIKIEEIACEEQKVKWLPSTRQLYWDTILELATEKEKPLLDLVLEAKRKENTSKGRRESLDTVNFREVRAEGNLASLLIKEMARIGKLYKNRQIVRLHPKDAPPLIYHITPAQSGRYAFRALFRFQERECAFDIGSLVGKGPPHWALLREELFYFPERLKWKWIEMAKTTGPEISADQVKELSDALEEREPDTVPLLEIDAQAVENPDPIPALKLTDNTGSFANLFMNYGGGNFAPVDPLFNKGRYAEFEAGCKKDLIEAGYAEKHSGSSQFYCAREQIGETLQLLLELGWEVYDKDGNRLLLQTGVDAAIEEGGAAILVKAVFRFGAKELPLAKAAARLQKGEFILSIGDGFSGLIDRKSFQNAIHALIDGETCPAGIKIPKYDLSAIQALAKEADLFSWEGMRERLKGMLHKTPGKSGHGFIGTLRNYQEEGVGWLAALYRQQLHGILADDMGLGKTVQVLAFLSTLEIKRPVLIVAPTSLIFNWKNECARFLPAVTVCIHHGAERARTWHELDSPQVILTSYAILTRDLALFAAGNFQCLFLDEAQAIKNPATQTARAACRLSADFRVSITGTPVENHAGELLSQFRFLIPGLFEKYGRESAPEPSILDKIRKKARPFILRRRKEDVLAELPEKIEQIVWLEMLPGQRVCYDRFLSELKQGLFKAVSAEGAAKHRMEILEALLRMRQICCHPLLFPSPEGDEAQGESAKCEALFEDLETILLEGKKALVYSQFTTMLQLLTKRAKEKRWKYAYLDGTTAHREAEVRKFQEEQDTSLFFISLKAGGVGLNLTAADYVFIYDPWWNQAVEEQAIDRAHRIGRHDTVFAKRYLIKDSIEEKMYRLKESKQALVRSLFADSQDLAGLDIEQLFQECFFN